MENTQQETITQSEKSLGEREYEKAKALNLPTQNIPLTMPRKVDSLCPTCLKHLEAEIYEKDNKIFMKKTCDEHGETEECLSDDAWFFKRNELLTFQDGWGQSNPQVTGATTCPESCGLCNQHLGSPCLINMDLTNRCNLKCPVCFANSNAAGYVYEPNLEQVKKMIQSVIDLRPVPAAALQFGGGEPTLSPIFFDALKLVKEAGITHLQAASNGIKFTEPGFAQKSKDAGLHTVYLQFDGVNDEAYKYTRNVPHFWNIKKKAIEEIGKAGMRVCLVTTIVRGSTDKNIGDIIKFAIDHEAVSSMSLQPISFTGRMSAEERKQQRFTLTDLATEVEKQTNGMITKYDFYPMGIVTPLSRLVDAIKPNENKHMISANHPHCGIATFLCINKETKEAIPLSRFIDVPAINMYMEELAKKLEGKSALLQKFDLLKALIGMKKLFYEEKAPKGMKFMDFVDFLKVFFNYSKEKNKKYSPWRMLFIASMHFQDGYNVETDRLKRCTVFYTSPDGKLYPFCTYNVGPYYREHVEKKFSIPLDEWNKQNKADVEFKGE